MASVLRNPYRYKVEGMLVSSVKKGPNNLQLFATLPENEGGPAKTPAAWFDHDLVACVCFESENAVVIEPDDVRRRP